VAEPLAWNFDDVFHRAPLLRYAGNTFLYAGLSTIGVVISSVPVAYALARLRWRGRNAALLLVLAMLMLPPQVTVVPLYSFWSDLNLTGHAVAADPAELLRRRVLDLPAAPVLHDDPRGVRRRRPRGRRGRAAVMISVVSRLAKPAIAAVALFAFLFAWNDFFLPLSTRRQPDNWPLSVGCRTSAPRTRSSGT
jgi:multiple sugar transport system permease protein